MVVLGEERSSEVLVALRGGAQASCADADGDGTAGVTAVTIEFGQPRGDARIVATIVPDRDEIDDDGWHPVTIQVGDTSIGGQAKVSFTGR